MHKVLLIVVAALFFLVSCNTGNDKKIVDQVQDTTETIESLTKQIRENPENADLFIRRSKLQFEQENIDEAINDLEIALKVDSKLPDVYNELCELYLLRGESGKAKDVLIKCLEIYPSNADARLKLAQIYFYVEMYKEAMLEIVNLENNDLQSSDSYFVKALILNETQAFDDAVKALRSAIEFNNDNWEAYNLIGMIYYRQDNPLAVEYFTTAARLFPNNLEIRFNAGLVFQHFSFYDKAITEYDYVISADSTYYQAYYNQGYVYVNGTGNYEAAVESFTNAIKVDSSSYKAWYNRGFTYEVIGKYKLAELDYRKALEILPNYDLAVTGLNEVIAKQR